MAKRNVLHISKLENLKKWLVKDGWQLLPLSNNHYEVLRAGKAGRQNPLVIYSAKSSEHLSFADKDMPVIGAFLRDQKKPQTNADRIRSMTDEDLAEVLFGSCIEHMGVEECSHSEEACKSCVLEWLREESEE